MFFITKSDLDKKLQERFNEMLKDRILELNKGSYYVVILPENLNTNEVKEVFNVLSGKGINVLVLQSDNVKILEIN